MEWGAFLTQNGLFVVVENIWRFDIVFYSIY